MACRHNPKLKMLFVLK